MCGIYVTLKASILNLFRDRTLKQVQGDGVRKNKMIKPEHKVSCIIPAYNEEKTVAGVVKTCLKAPEMPTTVTFPGPRNSNYSVDAALYRWSYVARDAIANQTCCLRIHRISLRAW